MMVFEKMVLWLLFIVGVCAFFYNLRKPPIKDWLIIFLITAFISSIFGVIVVEKELLSYPVNLFPHFDSSLTYEYVLFPVISIYFYKLTYHGTWKEIMMWGIVFSSAITVTEYFIERYTELIQYHTWTWTYTLISTYLLLLFVRGIVKLISYVEKNEAS